MTPIDWLGLAFALLALFAAAAFFWLEKKAAGFAFLVAFVVALAGVSQQRVVLSSLVIGVTVENGVRMPKPIQTPEVDEKK